MCVQMLPENFCLIVLLCNARTNTAALTDVEVKEAI